jgi:hypothetical protein
MVGIGKENPGGSWHRESPPRLESGLAPPADGANRDRARIVFGT